MESRRTRARLAGSRGNSFGLPVPSGSYATKVSGRNAAWSVRTWAARHCAAPCADARSGRLTTCDDRGLRVLLVAVLGVLRRRVPDRLQQARVGLAVVGRDVAQPELNAP